MVEGELVMLEVEEKDETKNKTKNEVKENTMCILEIAVFGCSLYLRVSGRPRSVDGEGWKEEED